MGNSQGRTRGPQVKSGPMITSMALAGAGVILTMSGFVVSTSHLLVATRRWMRDLEVPPSELARIKWAQAMAAAAAGGNAWQRALPPPSDQGRPRVATARGA
jgi:hypothetical protein